MKKEKIFKFYDYEISNNVSNLIYYLSLNNIEYEEGIEDIKFKLRVEDKYFEFNGLIKKDSIYYLSCHCACDDEKSYQIIRSNILDNYQYSGRDEIAKTEFYKSFPASNYNFSLSITKGIYTALKIYFGKSELYPLNLKDKKENIIDYSILGIFGILGLAMSIAFIWIYTLNKNIILHACLSLISYIFMTLGVFLIGKRMNVESKSLKLWTLFLPIIYFFVVFIILILINTTLIKEGTILALDCLMWSIYSMPAFIIVIIVVFLAMLAFSYA